MSASYKVWGDYSIEKIKETWEGEMPSGDLRALYDEGYNLEHCCSTNESLGEVVRATYCYVFVHRDHADTEAVCGMCSWDMFGSPAGTRDTISIRVPVGIPAHYATYREGVLRDLFRMFEDEVDDDIFDIDDDYPDGM